MRAILALDQGTTSSRAILFDHEGQILGVAQKEFAQHYPKPGWVEHDALEIWDSQLSVAQQVLSESTVHPADVAAIGITNQRETTLLWDRETGQPVHRAIVWQDRRTADFCERLASEGHAPLIGQRTGLVIDPYFCASKVAWLLDHVPGVRERADAGKIAFGTVDSWLIWKLTGGLLHVSDVTNASRTMFFDIHKMIWDHEILELLNIPQSVLPTVVKSCQTYGQTHAALFGTAIPIAGIAGDQQAALFGQNCVGVGDAKNTYGTGCFMLMNIGGVAKASSHKLLTTLTCTVDGTADYAYEGSIFAAGAAVNWLRDGLGIFSSSSEIETLAASVGDTGGLYLVPAFAGLGAPHWDAHARGLMVGITRGTTRAHIARAALEGIAFQVADVFDAMKQDASLNIGELRVDGGAAVNNLLMQFQADIMQVPVVRPRIVETTALGAAFLAGLAVGFWKDSDSLSSVWKLERRFEPNMSADEVGARRNRWKAALDRARNWDVVS